MAISREEAVQSIVEKASSDPTFRKELVSDPGPALESAFGATLPQGVKVSVLEETAQQYYLVLPAADAAAGTQLSDEALASVSGGNNSWNDNTCSLGNTQCSWINPGH